MGKNTGFDYVTMRYTSKGVLSWVQVLDCGNNSDDEATAMVLDTSGYVYVTGSGTVYFSDNLEQFVTVQYDLYKGTQNWFRSYGYYDLSYDYHDKAYCIAVDKKGRVYVSGESIAESTNPFSFINTVKYSAGGLTLTTSNNRDEQKIGDGSSGFFNRPFSLHVSSAGQVYLCGKVDVDSFSTGIHSNYIIVKSTSDLGFMWTEQYGSSAGGNDVATAITTDASNNVYVTGYSDGDSGSGENFDFLTIKYNKDGVQQWQARYDDSSNGEDRGTLS